MSEAVLAINDTVMTSVITMVETNHTIAFIGTDDGRIMKVNIINKNINNVYENISIGAGEAVRSDTYIDSAFDNLIVLTEGKLVKLPVANCSGFTSCDECIRPNEQDGDPYCGWCILSKTCTRYKDCEESFWLPSNTAQCIEISSIDPPFIPYTEDNIEIVLKIDQLPPLNINESYNCKFGESLISHGIQSGEILRCRSPPAKDVPQIQPGQISVEVPLSIHSSQTDVDFVTSQFTFFDCSTIKSCSKCVTSFTCDWCIYGNMCTHNSSVFCDADDDIITNNNVALVTLPGDKQGQGSCPRISQQTNEELIHAETQKNIRIFVENLPNGTQMIGYQCIVLIEGQISKISASLELSGDSILCSRYRFDYVIEEQEVIAFIQVSWNDNVIDNIYQVTLYKCNVQRPDCSRCLSTITTRQALDCVWCRDQCLYNRSCSKNVKECPAPVISEIFPESVATIATQQKPDYTEVIELSGKDFGKNISDIENIRIGGKECKLLYNSFDVASQRLKCTAPVFNSPADRDVIISVNGKEGTGVSITYQDPMVNEISPRFGIQAGGTKLTITGSFLNTGDALMVSIGGSECKITSISASKIMCTTAYDGVNEYVEAEVNVTVKFGEASREGSKFTYTPNPNVIDYQPKSSIQAGGRKITVTGSDFQHVQEAKMFVKDISTENNCVIESNIIMICESPIIDSFTSDQRRKRQVDDPNLPLAFSFDAFFPDLKEEFQFRVVHNPIYYAFVNGIVYGTLVEDGIYKLEIGTSSIRLLGSNINLASDESDVKVFIGLVECTVNSLSDTEVVVEAPAEKPKPEDSSSQDLPLVVIFHGNLEITLGPIRYPVKSLSLTAIVIIITCSLVVFIIMVFVLIWRYRSRHFIKKIDEASFRYFSQQSNLENEYSNREHIECAVLEASEVYMDMAVGDEERTCVYLQGRRHYVLSMIFFDCPMVPKIQDESTYASLLEDGTGVFNFDMLMDKDFIMKLVEILDNDSSGTSRIRQNFSALLLFTFAIEDRFTDLLNILEILLEKHIEDKVKSRKRKLVLNRTGTVIEFLISHVIACCMYDYTEKHVSGHVFKLIELIRTRTEDGAVDTVYHHSQYSINENYLLPPEITGDDLFLTLLLDENPIKQVLVKVKSCDTLQQVIQKLVNVKFKKEPFTARSNSIHFNIEWRASGNERIILKKTESVEDEDNLETKQKIKTIKEYGIKDNDIVALVNSQQIDGYMSVNDDYDRIIHRNDEESGYYETLADGYNYYHLLKSGPENMDQYEMTEIDPLDRSVLNRLVETKNIYQPDVNMIFENIFTDSTESLPIFVKYMFDLLDEQADKHGMSIQDLILWKNNCYATLFWLKLMKYPTFMCKSQQTPQVNITLDVITKVFQDSWSTELLKFNKNSPSHLQLYVNEIPLYRQRVSSFYKRLKEMPKCTLTNVTDEVKSSLQPFVVLVKKSSLFENLLQLTQEYDAKVKEAMENVDSYVNEERNGASQSANDYQNDRNKCC